MGLFQLVIFHDSTIVRHLVQSIVWMYKVYGNGLVQLWEEKAQGSFHFCLQLFKMQVQRRLRQIFVRCSKLSSIYFFSGICLPFFCPLNPKTRGSMFFEEKQDHLITISSQDLKFFCGRMTEADASSSLWLCLGLFYVFVIIMCSFLTILQFDSTPKFAV